jgi:putative ABC transport system permease protein
VFVSILIAIPIAWYGMNQWLLDFEYRVRLDIWVFVLSGLLALLIALLTVSYQSIKAAITNPIKSLR